MMGRKKLPPEKFRQKPLRIRLNPEERRLVDEAAEAEGLRSTSAWARRTLLRLAALQSPYSKQRNSQQGDSMTNTVKELMQLFVKLYYPRRIHEGYAQACAEYQRRDLVCTPYGGNYGRLAGWVVCVNGSPPKGTLISSVEGPDEVPTFFLAGTAKRMREKEDKIIQAFYNEHLKDKNTAFVIKTTENS
jgi:hypothetical protein